MEKVVFHLKGSFIGFCLLGGLYLGAIGVILIVPLPLGVKALFVPILLCLYWQCLRRYVFKRKPSSLVQLWQDPSQKWGCRSLNGRCFVGELGGASYKGSFFIILHLRASNHRIRTLFIPKDALSPFEYRLLSQRFFMT